MKVGDLVRKRPVATNRPGTVVSVKWLDTGKVLRCTHRSLRLVSRS
jgi:hypothetical protein